MPYTYDHLAEPRGLATKITDSIAGSFQATYDALGRTTALPGSAFNHYANDIAYQQTANGERQTWQLDAALRFRS
ncbi:hypothetical protein ADL06_02110 [Streptomyces sp. NRRL F-6491]|nr:hypothetical protein ADL06_02110 [Streptomyces sp. NRRL F-6491]KOX52381.1 hypothetical protein ADL08_02015 [Streptomyces sp. NRRL F-6492]